MVTTCYDYGKVLYVGPVAPIGCEQVLTGDAQGLGRVRVSVPVGGAQHAPLHSYSVRIPGGWTKTDNHNLSCSWFSVEQNTWCLDKNLT